MKKISIVRLIIIFVVAMCMQPVGYAGQAMNSTDLVRAIALGQNAIVENSQKLADDIARATAKMDELRKQLFRENTTSREDVGIVKSIMEQAFIVVLANHTLEKRENQRKANAANQNGQAGYLSQLKDIGSGLMGKIRALYDYSDDEKAIAREYITALTQQKSKIGEIFNQKKVSARYIAVIAQIDAVIYKQQLITGDVMSLQKKLLVGAVVAAGVAAGLALANSDVGPTIELQEVDNLSEAERAKLLKSVEEDKAKVKEQLADVNNATGDDRKKQEDQLATLEVKESLLTSNNQKKLEYINKLDLLDKRIAVAEEKAQEYKKTSSWWSRLTGSLPAEITIELKLANAEKEALMRNIDALVKISTITVDKGIQKEMGRALNEEPTKVETPEIPIDEEARKARIQSIEEKLTEVNKEIAKRESESFSTSKQERARETLEMQKLLLESGRPETFVDLLDDADKRIEKAEEMYQVYKQQVGVGSWVRAIPKEIADELNASTVARDDLMKRLMGVVKSQSVEKKPEPSLKIKKLTPRRKKNPLERR
jgi:hypothetical protein